MKKTPAVFKMGGDTRKKTYTDEVREEAAWVLEGFGVPTQKYDGTCCMIRDSKLYKRRALKTSKDRDFPPAGWIQAEPREGRPHAHWMGWMPVGEGNEDKFHREAWTPERPDGTYELCGPRIAKNPEGFANNHLVPHGQRQLWGLPEKRTFESLRLYMEGLDIEGIVFWHPDGRRAKITKAGYGMPRKPQ